MSGIDHPDPKTVITLTNGDIFDAVFDWVWEEAETLYREVPEEFIKKRISELCEAFSTNQPQRPHLSLDDQGRLVLCIRPGYVPPEPSL